ncbi:MAG: hypothetical protein R3B49_10210 [Phycisphaerales bacterium]
MIDGKARLRASMMAAGVVGGEGGLREVDELGGVVDGEAGDVVGDSTTWVESRCFAEGADDFLVVAVPDEENWYPLAA